MQSDIRIRNVRVGYEDFRYRTPIKFGGVAVDRVTILNVIVDAETRGGTVVTVSGRCRSATSGRIRRSR